MGQKYRVVCLAITDRLGNMHRNQTIRYEGAKAIAEDVILDESDFTPGQIQNYVNGGHIELYNKPSQNPVKKSQGRAKKDTGNQAKE